MFWYYSDVNKKEAIAMSLYTERNDARVCTGICRNASANILTKRK